jgi:uncharacterized metal-binding protein YceD (DUF177 family)
VSEFSRIVDAARLPLDVQVLIATPEECAALAQRFGLVAVHSLSARVTLASDGPAVNASGTLSADVVQSCAVSGEDLPVRISETLSLRFVPAPDERAAEVELEAEDLDEIEMEAGRFDLGEAVAQSLALAIDPYLEGPGADEFRRKSGILSEGESGKFGALKGLLKK